MLLSHRPTLTDYLIGQRRRFPDASGDFNALLLDVALACKAIARAVAFGELAGEGGVAAAERIPPQSARGKYLLLFDALDGAGNIDVNLSVGSLFGVLRAPVGHDGAELPEAAFLQPGTALVAAGYALYGPKTVLVLSVGRGVAGFTLEPNLGEFMLTHPDIRVPSDTQEFAIHACDSRFWELPVKRYVDECLAGRAGPRGKDFNMRWIASMVAEAHRILMRGGVFMQPCDTRDTHDPGRSARARLLHEAHPIGFIVEQAGGRASTGRQPVLAVTPASMQQRVGLLFGSRNEVERIERYHHEPATRDPGVPLFHERSLFRD